ncbi:hypothetical protein CC78DRAFT_324651 [Lojkania enalia]|uniref:Uncharacterized protein n=1 Tax=Lojkania enalia TaxID=147567 RepID=A0A9P4K9X8_9PLEO|nr:hypothetical protein CC78DRAFT_324651 [Didymosphaeria enalia]
MLSTQKNTARQPRKWTITEDQRLREEVEAQMSGGEVKDWCKIAARIPGRTNKDCRKRWTNSVAGGLKKGQWARSEDILLSRGVQKYGQRWVLVAEIVQSRSADQCAKRWQQSLDPELDRSEWRESEDKVLIQAVQKLGRHWKDIQRQHFPGRSKNCIKNRYTVLVRRYQNQGISLPDGTDALNTLSPNNRLSAYSATDDDSSSYTPSVGMYDELLTSRTQVSTPETHSSWSFDEEPFTSWPPQETFSITSGPSDYTSDHQNVTRAGTWGWPASTIDSPPAIPLETTAAYSSTYSPPTLPAYSTYGAMQTIFGPTSAPLNNAGNRTSFITSPIVQPRSSPTVPNVMPYHDPEAMARFMQYKSQAVSPF